MYFQVFAGFGLPLRRGHSLTINESVWELLPVVLVPLVIAALLLAYRRHFSGLTPTPPCAAARWCSCPLLLLAFVGLYSVAWLAEGNLAGSHGMGGLLASIPRILLPLPLPFSYAAGVYPQGFFSELLFSFGGPCCGWSAPSASWPSS